MKKFDCCPGCTNASVYFRCHMLVSVQLVFILFPENGLSAKSFEKSLLKNAASVVGYIVNPLLLPSIVAMINICKSARHVTSDVCCLVKWFN